MRSNLDPFDNYTDEELQGALSRVYLGSGANEPGNLNTPVSEGGSNFSQGQRQLLCLARALVSRSRIMVLDEATSAVDMATDALIQRSIRGFSGTTLLVIAHRLSTVADFDRVLVLDAGRVAEFGPPRDLWTRRPTGAFRALCERSGERTRLKSVILGETL